MDTGKPVKTTFPLLWSTVPRIGERIWLNVFLHGVRNATPYRIIEVTWFEDMHVPHQCVQLNVLEIKDDDDNSAHQEAKQLSLAMKIIEIIKGLR